MPKLAYDMYMTTFERAAAMLRTGDEQRMRSLCAEVAMRDGIDSTLSLMALSDAERGLPRRIRSQVLAVYWREAVVTGDVPLRPPPDSPAPMRRAA